MADDFHDGNDARRYRTRLRRQRRYQADYRSRMKDARAPQKSDFAAACLEELLLMLASDPDAASGFARRVLKRIVRTYDRQASVDRFSDLVARAARRADTSGETNVGRQ